MWKLEFRQNYYRTSFSPTVPPFAAMISRVVADGGTWRLKWERLKVGESNGKLPPITCLGCSVPEPYRSHNWALVPAKPGLQGWILMNEPDDAVVNRIDTRNKFWVINAVVWKCSSDWRRVCLFVYLCIITWCLTLTFHITGTSRIC